MYLKPNYTSVTRSAVSVPRTVNWTTIALLQRNNMLIPDKYGISQVESVAKCEIDDVNYKKCNLNYHEGNLKFINLTQNIHLFNSVHLRHQYNVKQMSVLKLVIARDVVKRDSLKIQILWKEIQHYYILWGNDLI